jgi:1-acyl-sn-glycerol-3-phosphate acyltransferase
VFRKFFLWLINISIFFICDLEISGREKIPRRGSCILAANHLGRLDVFLVYHVLQREDIIVTIAEKYHKFAIFRVAAKALNAIWIHRYEADAIALRQVLRRLHNGEILAIAPEGTRSKTGALAPGKHGTVYLSSKAQIPILPVSIIGTKDSEVMDGIKRLKRSKVSVFIGDPISIPIFNRLNRIDLLNHYTDELMCRIASKLPEKYYGEYRNHPRLKEIVE